ncbi:MAG: murein biosynthesis integral membrane protein MurJ [Puniceicoccaceae bacterium]|nr:MAG: murein biosynthesis integral membrane protein MurJ [Puniceicoccaceae bacterium]
MSSRLERIGVVAVATVLSRVLGLVRDMLVTGVFGAGLLNSAFVTAFTLPNLFRRLLGEGALTAAVIPSLGEELERGGRAETFRVFNQVLTWLAAATVLLTVLAWGVFWGLERAPVGERWQMAAHLGKWLFPYLIFICLAALFAALLNLLHRFGIPALTAVWLNLAIIGMLAGPGLLLGRTDLERMYFLCGGVLLGGLLQLLVPALALAREGWRPGWDFGLGSRLREIGWLMAPGFFGAAIFQINIMVSRGLALSLNEEAATLLYLANRLVEVPIGIFAVAVATVAFPQLASLAARGETAAFAKTYHEGVRLTLALMLPAAIGLLMLRAPVVRVLFERGAFEAGDTALLVPVIFIFALGLPFYAHVSMVTRAFYSLKDTATPVKVAAGAFVLNLVLSLWLMALYGTNGLAVASNLATAIQTVVLGWILARRRSELRFAPQLTGLAKVLLATAGMALWLALVKAWAGEAWRGGLVMAVGIPSSVAVYGVLLWVTRFEGRDALAARLRRLVGRRGQPGPKQ